MVFDFHRFCGPHNAVTTQYFSRMPAHSVTKVLQTVADGRAVLLTPRNSKVRFCNRMQATFIGTAVQPELSRQRSHASFWQSSTRRKALKHRVFSRAVTARCYTTAAYASEANCSHPDSITVRQP